MGTVTDRFFFLQKRDSLVLGKAEVTPGVGNKLYAGGQGSDAGAYIYIYIFIHTYYIIYIIYKKCKNRRGKKRSCQVRIILFWLTWS